MNDCFKSFDIMDTYNANFLTTGREKVNDKKKFRKIKVFYANFKQKETQMHVKCSIPLYPYRMLKATDIVPQMSLLSVSINATDLGLSESSLLLSLLHTNSDGMPCIKTMCWLPVNTNPLTFLFYYIFL